MSEIKSLAAPKASFDRRAVVKGAAWSVPVIAAAIAAPAAAASARTATAAFDYVAGNGISVVNLDASLASKSATGPTGFHIQNTPGAFTGTITGSIRITPNPAAKGDPGLGIKSFPAASLSGANLSDSQKGALADANVYTSTFSYTNTVQSNAVVPFPMTFYYRGLATSPARNFLVTVTLTLPGRTSALVITAPVNLA